MRQKAGEIQVFRAFERGTEKWCKEHIQRKETDPISEEGLNLLDDIDRWRDHNRLVPQGGRVQKETGGMVETNISEIPRTKENSTGNYS